MNISDTIEPKVDQLTADHLIGQTKVIRVTAVHLAAGDQPCEIRYENDGGLPYRPGKSMRRVLVHAWGNEVAKYVGRSMRLYRDDDVQFGGLKVGGIRISHMSDISGPLTLALTQKKGSKKAFKVLPLVAEAPAQDRAQMAAAQLVARIQAASDHASLQEVTADQRVVEQRAWMAEKRAELATLVDNAVQERLAAFDGDAAGANAAAESAAA